MLMRYAIDTRERICPWQGRKRLRVLWPARLGPDNAAVAQRAGGKNSAGANLDFDPVGLAGGRTAPGV
jgi:hypothetical protein